MATYNQELIAMLGILVIAWGGFIEFALLGFGQVSLLWLSFVCFSYLIYSYFHRKREMKKEFDEIMALAKKPEGKNGFQH